MGVNAFIHQYEVGVDSVPPQLPQGEQRGVEKVAIDMTASIACELGWPDGENRPPLCVAFRDTLGCLGIGLVTAEESPTHCTRVIAEGNAAEIPKLAAEKLANNHTPGSLRNRLAKNPPDASLLFTVGRILLPYFASSTTNNVPFVIGRRSGELVIADKNELGPFDTYDIGGMEIDSHGRPPFKEISLPLRFMPETLETFRVIARDNDSSAADTMRKALLDLDKVNPILLQKPKNVRPIKFQEEKPKTPLRIPRDICQKAQTIAETYGCTTEEVIETYLKQHAREVTQDPDIKILLEEARANKAKLENALKSIKH